MMTAPHRHDDRKGHHYYIRWLRILLNGPVNEVIAAHPLLMLVEQVFFAGVICALGVVLFTGIPLAVVAWRSTPHVRFLLTAMIWRTTPRQGFLSIIPFLFFGLLF